MHRSWLVRSFPVGAVQHDMSQMENEFYRHYKERVMPALREQHGYKNVHQVPKVDKVVINTSIGSQSEVKQALDDAKLELALITGQRPAETRAKKSISNFKLRKDQAIGAKVTLRGERMYEFLERLIKAALPRIRDFRGVSPRGFDGHGKGRARIKGKSGEGGPRTIAACPLVGCNGPADSRVFGEA